MAALVALVYARSEGLGEVAAPSNIYRVYHQPCVRFETRRRSCSPGGDDADNRRLDALSGVCKNMNGFD